MNQKTNWITKDKTQKNTQDKHDKQNTCKSTKKFEIQKKQVKVQETHKITMRNKSHTKK